MKQEEYAQGNYPYKEPVKPDARYQVPNPFNDNLQNADWNPSGPNYPNYPNGQVYPANYSMSGPNGEQPPLKTDEMIAWEQINGGVNQGFGENYFNPNSGKKNIPEKLEPAKHTAIMMVNLLFLALLVTAIIGFNRFLDTGGFIAIIIVPYFFYLFIACCCSDIKGYIEKMKKFDDYQETYDKMVRGKGYFKFHIECYHYVRRSTRRGQSSSRKVVTHTATENFICAESIDESGQLMNIEDIKNFVFINYLKRYNFVDEQSEARFKDSFKSFVARNTRDKHQSYNHTFMIENHEEIVCYTALGENSKSKVLFYVFTLLGMALPYACIFESSVARYNLGMLKRLRV